jgi:hypothetical protein
MGGDNVGFGHQFIKALIPPLSDGPARSRPTTARPDAPAFQALRTRGETLVDAADDANLESTLPLFPSSGMPTFYGARTAAGEDTYVLCEINVSCVSVSLTRRRRRRCPLGIEAMFGGGLRTARMASRPGWHKY